MAIYDTKIYKIHVLLFLKLIPHSKTYLLNTFLINSILCYNNSMLHLIIKLQVSPNKYNNYRLKFQTTFIFSPFFLIFFLILRNYMYNLSILN